MRFFLKEMPLIIRRICALKKAYLQSLSKETLEMLEAYKKLRRSIMHFYNTKTEFSNINAFVPKKDPSRLPKIERRVQRTLKEINHAKFFIKVYNDEKISFDKI